MKAKRPYLLSITLYSVLVIQIIILAVVGFIMVFNDDMNQLRSFFNSSIGENHTIKYISISLVLILISVFSVIQMLRKKIVATYIFNVISLLVISYLIFSYPIDFVNVLALIIINYIIYIYRSWFTQKTEETGEEN